MTARRFLPFFAALLCFAFQIRPANGASWEHKRSKSDRDINAVGHRTLRMGKDWYPREKQTGDQIEAMSEQSTELLRDPAITSYIDAVAQRIARNSDATFPITVHIINRRQPMAYTMMGGHQFISWGMLMQLQSEGELSSILARGIAHTALRSPAVQWSHLNLMRLASLPSSSMGPASYAVGIYTASQLGMISFARMDEGDADYFGIQYVYQAGYDTNCFLSALQRIWPVDQKSWLSSFPPTNERVKALQKEITQIPPRQDSATTSTSEFDEFQKRLQILKPREHPTDPDARPKLIRHPAT